MIYLVAMILFITKEKIGKWFVMVWMFMWFVIQFLCHEWYTIFNSGFIGTLEGKIKYFSETIQWLQIEVDGGNYYERCSKRINYFKHKGMG